MHADSGRLLRYAGFVIWGLTGLPLLVEIAQFPAFLGETSYWLWLVCFVIFGVAFGLTGWKDVGPRSRPRQIASLVTQTGAALAMIRLVCSGQEGALLVIVSAQLGWVLPFGRALAWVFAQAALSAIWTLEDGFDEADARLALDLAAVTREMNGG